MTQRVDYRTLSGAGAHTPPNLEPRSRSEGDLNRNSFRNSDFPRLSLRAVCNDDGSPIAEDTNDLLRQVLEELRALRSALAKE